MRCPAGRAGVLWQPLGNKVSLLWAPTPSPLSRRPATRDPVAMPMEPSFIEHDAIGRLTWDEETREFAGRYEIFADLTIDLSVDPFTDVLPDRYPSSTADPDGLAEAVASMVQQLGSRLDLITAYAARELLPVYNEQWTEGHPIDEGAFVGRLRLLSIKIDQDLRADVFFDDGGLFAGHAVIVSTNESGEAIYAQFFG